MELTREQAEARLKSPHNLANKLAEIRRKQKEKDEEFFRGVEKIKQERLKREQEHGG